MSALNMQSHKLLYAMLFIAIITPVRADTSDRDAPIGEAQRSLSIQDDIETIPPSYYFLEIFGGVFPIPNRYAVANWVGGPLSEVVLSSPIVGQDGKPVLSWSSDLGTIVVGKFNERAAAAFYDVSPDVRVTRIRVCGSVSVDRFDYSDWKRRNEEWRHLNIGEVVLIHDEQDYLTISDEDPDLWKTLFQRYCDLNSLSVREAVEGP